MKFYVISIILTVIVLFIPIAQKITADSEENTIVVSLESMETIEEAEDSNSMESSVSSGGSHRIEEKQVVKQQEKIENNLQIKENKKEVIVNNQKSSASEKKSDKEINTSDLPNTSGSTSSKQDGNSRTGSGVESDKGNGVRGGTDKGTTEAGTGKESDSKSVKTYGCVKGKGYKMLSNPKIKLNKAQVLIIPSGTRVIVSAFFTANGFLNITGISGGNSEAQKLVRKTVGGIRVNVIDKTITKCNVTLTYTLKE